MHALTFATSNAAGTALVLEGLAHAEAPVRVKYVDDDEVVGIVADGGEYHGEPFLYLTDGVDENGGFAGPVEVGLDRVVKITVEV